VLVTVLLYALGTCALAAGLVGLVVPVVPGALLLVAGTFLVAWAEGFTRVGWGIVAVSVLVAALVAMVDVLAGVLGAKAFGASRWAALGASLGLLAGLFFGVPGILLGPVVGAMAFEAWRNPDVARAAKAGLGTALGLLVGGAVKLALGFALVGAVVVALLR